MLGDDPIHDDLIGKRVGIAKTDIAIETECRLRTARGGEQVIAQRLIGTGIASRSLGARHDRTLLHRELLNGLQCENRSGFVLAMSIFGR